jgi:glucose-6-phosphate-specific signal transduction histidine kinase
VAVATATAALAFANGAVRISGDDYSTEFVDDPWWVASLLLVIPVFFIARAKGWLGAAVAVLVGAVQVVVAAITVHRYQVSGWSDGLESFAYLEAFAFAFVFAIAAFAGWRVGRRHH